MAMWPQARAPVRRISCRSAGAPVREHSLPPPARAVRFAASPRERDAPARPARPVSRTDCAKEHEGAVLVAKALSRAAEHRKMCTDCTKRRATCVRHSIPRHGTPSAIAALPLAPLPPRAPLPDNILSRSQAGFPQYRRVLAMGGRRRGGAGAGGAAPCAGVADACSRLVVLVVRGCALVLSLASLTTTQHERSWRPLTCVSHHTGNTT